MRDSLKAEKVYFRSWKFGKLISKWEKYCQTTLTMKVWFLPKPKCFDSIRPLLTRWGRNVQSWTFYAFFHKNEGFPLNEANKITAQNFSTEKDEKRPNLDATAPRGFYLCTNGLKSFESFVFNRWKNRIWQIASIEI